MYIFKYLGIKWEIVIKRFCRLKYRGYRKICICVFDLKIWIGCFIELIKLLEALYTHQRKCESHQQGVNMLQSYSSVSLSHQYFVHECICAWHGFWAAGGWDSNWSAVRDPAFYAQDFTTNAWLGRSTPLEFAIMASGKVCSFMLPYLADYFFKYE